MIYLQFNEDEEKIRIRYFCEHNKNLVEILLPDNSILKTKDISKGFKIFNFGKEKDYSEYTTRYDIISNTIQQAFFSNDESTETENNKIKYVIKPCNCIEYDEEDLEKARESIIDNTKLSLQNFLNIPFVSYAHNNTKGYYTVTMEKQNLMMARLMTYNMEKLINPNAVIKWNEKDKSCELWTEEEFFRFVMEVKNYVDPVVSYQQTLEEKIRACTTMEEIESIEINYSQFKMEVI